MSALPLPIRVAAGLAAIALERARKLPRDVTEWPMTAVSQALQVSMRVQQRITELAIKGDEALAGLREPQEDPPWAVFDEDRQPPSYLRQPGPNSGSGRDGGTADAAGAPAGPEQPSPGPAFEDELDVFELGRPDVTTAEEQSWLDAIDEVYQRPAEAGTVAGTPAENAAASAETADTPVRNGGHAGEGPGVLPGYPGLTLASLRARLRVLSVQDLEELLAYERGHGDRPEFVRLLTNRIATVRNR
jgi:hypothetical protein